MSQQDLATAVGLERTMVNRIEGGQRKVTALELASIADALGTRMQSFFTEPAPALVSHRSAQGLDTTESAVDHLLAELAALGIGQVAVFDLERHGPEPIRDV